VERIKVTKGTVKEIQLVTADKLNLVVPKGQNKNIQKKVITENSLKAPVTAGQKYGELVAIKDGAEMGKVDLVAERTVDKAGFFQVFQTLLSSLFTITG
jgi:serine-type D-Ala-D-Ala carboxypeptidase (penicillin-binding protein 5/6)